MSFIVDKLDVVIDEVQMRVDLLLKNGVVEISRCFQDNVNALIPSGS